MSAPDEPYVFDSGDAWGDERPEPRDLPRPRWKHALGARAHRARTDPLWHQRDDASKRALIALDNAAPRLVVRRRRPDSGSRPPRRILSSADPPPPVLA